MHTVKGNITRAADGVTQKTVKHTVKQNSFGLSCL